MHRETPGLGREFVGADQGPWPSHGRSSVHPSRPHSGRACQSDRISTTFPSLIKSPVGNGSLQLSKIAEASERLNGNQHVIEERPVLISSTATRSSYPSATNGEVAVSSYLRVNRVPTVEADPEASPVGFLWFKLVLFHAHSTAQPGFN